MGFRIGVDEAGRGSIVGEMFIAAFAMPDEVERVLAEMGVRDSKKLSPAKRAELYNVLKMWPFAVKAITPRDIDSYNINKLEIRAVIDVLGVLARRLGESFENARIVVDKFGDVREELLRALARMGFRGILVVEEDADEKYVEVSAASIIAKHLRDRRIKVLRSLYGVEGSGYPSDPRTIGWIERVVSSGLKPPVIRYSWATMDRFGLRVKKKPGLTFKTLDEYLSGGIEGEDSIR